MKSSEQCPYTASLNVNQPSAPTSPQEVLPSAPQESPTAPPHDQGWRNFMRLQQQGPHVFFGRMSARTQKSFFKVRVGPKNMYQVTHGKLAEDLLSKYAKNLGRGDLLGPFKSMVGDVFFANDGPLAAKTRRVFSETISRFEENFQRMAEINARTLTATQLTDGIIPDLYAFVAWHTIGCIAACFVGTDDLSAIPAETHKTFLKATRQITQASMDPLSRLVHPCLRSEFREASAEMANIAKQLLYSNIDAVCKGNNYIWDLAIFRAQQLHPEMNFDNCTHFETSNAQAQIVRELIEKDHFVLEHGPLTIFASSNVGATMFYLLHILSEKPDITNIMRSEITRVLGDEQFTYEHLARLPYVRAVVQEALWQATPIPTFPREVLSPFEASINGQTVSFQKGDTVMLHFRPMQGPAREFEPRQWFSENNSSPTLFAFGTGHRRCPARPFAEQLLIQFLVSMTSHNLHIVLDQKPTYTTRNGNLGPDYRPEQPVTAIVQPIDSKPHYKPSPM